MRRFAALCETLDSTDDDTVRVATMARYFAATPPADAAWAVRLLAGETPKRLVPAHRLQQWAGEAADLPDWLVEVCRKLVGSAAETAALLADGLPQEEEAGSPAAGLAARIEEEIVPLRGLPVAEQKERVMRSWSRLDPGERRVFNDLLAGMLRVGVTRSLVLRALARVSGLDPAILAHRLAGNGCSTADAFTALLAPATADDDLPRPYPFARAAPLRQPPETLGAAVDWACEWQWDGIRAQLVRRGGACFLWSSDRELVTQRFPELARAAAGLPDGTVLEGEIVARDAHGVMPFTLLQRRARSERPGETLLRAVPVVFLAGDLLEEGGSDIRAAPLADRRARLERLLAGVPPPLCPAPAVSATDWTRLAALCARAREHGAEGLLLRRARSPTPASPEWEERWLWRAEPFTVDAVLLYARRGGGPRGDLYADYTFAVRDGEALVPVARTCSGLPEGEAVELDHWIRRHTRERFGPARAVEPVQLFELAFEGIARSRRHKSGLALRLPRILRWYRDRKADSAGRLDELNALLDGRPGR